MFKWVSTCYRCTSKQKNNQIRQSELMALQGMGSGSPLLDRKFYSYYSRVEDGFARIKPGRHVAKGAAGCRHVNSLTDYRTANQSIRYVSADVIGLINMIAALGG